MYRSIFFDFDGTVYDTVEGITKCVSYALKKFGIDAEPETLRCFAGPPLDLMFHEKFGFDPAQCEQAIAWFRERYVPIGVHESTVFPGMRELLTELRAAGMKLAVATTKPTEMAMLLLAQEDMVGCFDCISGSHPGNGDEAKSTVLRRAMEALDASPDSSVLVGDTKFDVLGARECGIPCIGALYGYAAEGELERFGAIALAENIAELQELLLKG